MEEKHCQTSGHRRATEVEGDQTTPGKEICRKKCGQQVSGTAGWRWRHKTELDGDKYGLWPNHGLTVSSDYRAEMKLPTGLTTIKGLSQSPRMLGRRLVNRCDVARSIDRWRCVRTDGVVVNRVGMRLALSFHSSLFNTHSPAQLHGEGRKEPSTLHFRHCRPKCWQQRIVIRQQTTCLHPCAIPPPSSSSCTWNLLSIFFIQISFPGVVWSPSTSVALRCSL